MTIIHQLMHVLGFFPEQSRDDMDKSEMDEQMLNLLYCKIPTTTAPSTGNNVSAQFSHCYEHISAVIEK